MKLSNVRTKSVSSMLVDCEYSEHKVAVEMVLIEGQLLMVEYSDNLTLYYVKR